MIKKIDPLVKNKRFNFELKHKLYAGVEEAQRENGNFGMGIRMAFPGDKIAPAGIINLLIDTQLLKRNEIG